MALEESKEDDLAQLAFGIRYVGKEVVHLFDGHSFSCRVMNSEDHIAIATGTDLFDQLIL